MILVILGAVVGLVVTLYIIWEEFLEEIITKILLSLFFAPLVAFVGALAGVLIAMMCAVGANIAGAGTTETITDSYRIYSMADNIGVSGQFALGSGSVGGEDYIYYMVDTDKGYQIRSQKTSNSYIKQTDQQPYIEVVEYDYENAILRWLTVPMFDDSYIFHTPADTVKIAYNVDLN